MKNKGFLKGATILGIAGIIVKILGAIYRIPISNIMKTEGMGYYQTAYPFYMLLLTISTAGFPVAIAKLVSERRAINDYRGSKRVLKVSLLGLGFIGLVSSLIVYINADRIAKTLGNKNAYYSLVALVPALFFIPIMSAFRGYYQGENNMVPTAISQIFEQLFRVVSGLYMSYKLMDISVAKAAGGASFGGSVGAFMGFLVILIIYIRDYVNSKGKEIQYDMTKYEYKDIIKDLLTIAIPITIGAAIAPIMDAIDTKLVLNRLQDINYSELEANELFGQLKGFAQTLINFPQVFSIAIGMSLVPVIAESRAKMSNTKVEKTINSGIRITLLIGLPATIGLFVLSEEIIGLLYFNNTKETIVSTGIILKYLSLSVVFLTLSQTSTSIIQGLGKPIIPVINLLIGAIVKIILTYYLTAIPNININGAAISTIFAYLISSILNLISIHKLFDINLDYNSILKKPLISAIFMGIIVKVSYYFIINIFSSKVATLLSIIIGGVSYIILLFLIKAITIKDIKYILHLD